MKQDDLIVNLNKCKTNIEKMTLTHYQITRLWIQINALTQTIEDYEDKNNRKDTPGTICKLS